MNKIFDEDAIAEMMKKLQSDTTGRKAAIMQQIMNICERAGKEGLPKVKRPLDAVAADVTQKGQRSVVQGSGLSVLVLGLEKRHLPPENRRVSDGRILLGRLKETLLAGASLLVGLPETHEVCVILDDLAREASLGWDSGDGLVCAGSAG